MLQFHKSLVILILPHFGTVSTIIHETYEDSQNDKTNCNMQLLQTAGSIVKQRLQDLDLDVYPNSSDPAFEEMESQVTDTIKCLILSIYSKTRTISRKS